MGEIELADTFFLYTPDPAYRPEHAETLALLLADPHVRLQAGFELATVMAVLEQVASPLHALVREEFGYRVVRGKRDDLARREGQQAYIDYLFAALRPSTDYMNQMRSVLVQSVASSQLSEKGKPPLRLEDILPHDADISAPPVYDAPLPDAFPTPYKDLLAASDQLPFYDAPLPEEFPDAYKNANHKL